MKPATDENVDQALREIAAQFDPERELLQLALYEHPQDAPEHYVVRVWLVGALGPRMGPGFGFRTQAEALAWVEMVFPHLAQLAPDPGDYPNLVAVWT